MRDLGIKSHLLLLTLLPACLLALGLGGYFAWNQLSNLHERLLEQGQMYVESLAPLVAPALSTNNQPLLDHIAQEALEQPFVRSVSFLDGDRTVIAHSGPSMRYGTPVLIPQHSLFDFIGNETSRFVLPVSSHYLSYSTVTNSTPNQLLGWVEVEYSHHGPLLYGIRKLLISTALVLLALSLAGLFALRMSRRINQPIQQIKEGVALLRDGHLETRLAPLGSPELDTLAQGINHMAESLQQAQEELMHSIEQATEDVRQNLETIEIQNIELDFARKEALEASRIKSEFLANMSHEIRTPLNGILGFTNLLQKSELTPRQQEYLDTIEKSADNLLSIINEILDFSKIEAGKLVLESIPFNLPDLIQDTLEILAPAAHEKHLELVSLIYRDVPTALFGDPLRLRQILTNLVNNAIKFTHTGSIVIRIMIEGENESEAQLRISVTDTGIGMSEESQHDLFKAFTQVDNSLSRQVGGTGLGLVISKRLIEQMNGDIGVISEPGKGAEFWLSVTLPKAQSTPDGALNKPLQNQRIAVYEPHELSRLALINELENCGLKPKLFDQLEDLRQTLTRPDNDIKLVVLGVTAQLHSPQQLYQPVWDLDQAGCKILVLCPTTEQDLYHEVLPEVHIQTLSKPVSLRKLQKALRYLLPATPAESPLVPAGQVNILCVDDNPANLLLAQALLEGLGAQVTAVESGFAAIEAVQQKPFDLIFMDVQMPGMDGRQTTVAIRNWESEHKHRSTPIVALTAHALAYEKRALLEHGMDDYLTKPIDEEQLLQVILKWTGVSLHYKMPTETAPPSPGNKELPVYDPKESLRLAAGKQDLADEMLRMLLNTLPEDLRLIRLYRAENDRIGLAERVHRLHGATRYCGVPQLRIICQRCETELKQNVHLVEQTLDELEAAIERLAQQTNTLL